MSPYSSNRGLTRRAWLQLSAASAAGLAFPASLAAIEPSPKPPQPAPGQGNLYASLLQTWCDGLLAHQLTEIREPALYGALLCPACGLVHGRCGDAIYPLLHVAHTTGDPKYLRAARLVYDWTERNVSRSDGSWVNDVTLSSWQGITVFHTIALAEALHHHGSLLDPSTRKQWMARLAAAAKFLDGFITIETGNINYPITASYGFALCGQVLANPRYTERGRALAHQALEYFTPNNLIAGEGHPLKGVTPKGCRPVDLGYNVEESLPALTLYCLLAGDQTVLDKTTAALRSHLEFMLPDGAWDNSWGTRNYKWSYWGSRTSDGCQPAFALLAGRDPMFREAAQRNLEQMAACTHNGLLYGGPDYFAHGDSACIHHTFTHAKALATVLDRKAAGPATAGRVALPRDQPYGLKSFPEIGTHLASIGDWRATITENDWEYIEHVQAGGAGSGGGGHATGGALSFLYHQHLGPLLTASMTEYQMIEISNQQAFRDKPHMTLTPRIECVTGGQTYTSLSDLSAVLTAISSAAQIECKAHGILQTASHQPAPGTSKYHLTYILTPARVEIIAMADSGTGLRYILPVISNATETLDRPDAQTIRIHKPRGTLTVHTTSPRGFEPVPAERTFNLVPGFECVPLSVLMEPGKPTQIHLSFS